MSKSVGGIDIGIRLVSGSTCRHWYDVEFSRWRDYPIPDGARIEIFGQNVVHIVPTDWPETEELFCEDCG